MRYEVRRLEYKHAGAICSLIVDLAKFQKTQGQVNPNEQNLGNKLFNEKISGFGAFTTGGILFGFCLVIPQYSSNNTESYYELHDLFLHEAQRGGTVAQDLMQELAKHSLELSLKDLGWDMISLEVLEWNKRAIAFYKKLGGAQTYRKVKESGEVCLGMSLSVKEILERTKV